ncbi:hypothetical protein AFB00_02280 [Pseudonocardia sp. HH130630-07]|nr:hypothetical protein AFB00_02280 [Pseudonocardia sp. HH130630-07]
MTRSSGARDATATAGAMTVFATSAGPRSAPVSTTSPTSTGSVSTPSRCNTGTRPMGTAAARSAHTDTRRGPIRSRTGPTRTLATT